MTARAALVTGGASGIGEAIARRLCARGYRVAICSRTSVEAGRAVADDIGGVYYQCDIADEKQARELVARTVAEFGRLDVLVNNAATTVRIPWHQLEDNTPEIWRKILDTNLVAPYVLTTAAAGTLREAKGCVINVSSVAGTRAVGASIPYAASKAALNHLTAILARVLAPDVRVNAVAPGYIVTPWNAGGERASMTGQFVDATPLQRGGTIEEVADAVDSLVEATFITGQVLLVDGGVSTSTI